MCGVVVLQEPPPQFPVSGLCDRSLTRRVGSGMSLYPLHLEDGLWAPAGLNLRVCEGCQASGIPPSPTPSSALRPLLPTPPARRSASGARSGQTSPTRGRSGAGRALREAGGGRAEREGRGRVAASPRSPRASNTCRDCWRAASPRVARSSLPPPAPRLPRSGTVCSAQRGPTRRQRRPRELRPAPPAQAMWIALPGPAGGISTARPAAPATSGDYDPESAALPGPPLSQPGHSLPPDRVSALRVLSARAAEAKLTASGREARCPT